MSKKSIKSIITTKSIIQAVLLTLTILTCAHTQAQPTKATMNSFDSVKMDLDGDSTIIIHHTNNTKHDLQLTVDKNGEQEVLVKDNVLYINCKKKNKLSSLKVRCVLYVPGNVQKLKIAAGSSNVVVNGYAKKLKVNAGTLDLSVEDGMDALVVNAGTLKGTINKQINELQVSAGTAKLTLCIENVMRQFPVKININAGTCTCLFELPKNFIVAYDIGLLVRCASDFPNYADCSVNKKVDCEISINSANGKLKLVAR